mmetsp:Transcript_118722/g.335840  ORF Transcript_118722/g.335840 Transcript_118722/m.335840 type:complete len:83 (-) Transcript_118722:455-703(-)
MTAKYTSMADRSTIINTMLHASNILTCFQNMKQLSLCAIAKQQHPLERAIKQLTHGFLLTCEASWTPDNTTVQRSLGSRVNA